MGGFLLLSAFTNPVQFQRRDINGMRACQAITHPAQSEYDRSLTQPQPEHRRRWNVFTRYVHGRAHSVDQKCFRKNERCRCRPRFNANDSRNRVSLLRCRPNKLKGLQYLLERRKNMRNEQGDSGVSTPLQSVHADVRIRRPAPDKLDNPLGCAIQQFVQRSVIHER